MKSRRTADNGPSQFEEQMIMKNQTELERLRALEKAVKDLLKLPLNPNPDVIQCIGRIQDLITQPKPE